MARVASKSSDCWPRTPLSLRPAFAPVVLPMFSFASDPMEEATREISGGRLECKFGDAVHRSILRGPLYVVDDQNLDGAFPRFDLQAETLEDFEDRRAGGSWRRQHSGISDIRRARCFPRKLDVDIRTCR